MQNKILTDRLTLNRLSSGDEEFMLRLLNSKGWLEYIGDRHVHTCQEAFAYINKILDSPNIFYWVVRIKDHNVPAGIVSFLKRPYLEHFDIGFAFLPEFAGRGYALESSKEILSVVSASPAFHPVLAATRPDNFRSVRLLHKLGLRFEKELDIGKKKLQIYTNAQ